MNYVIIITPGAEKDIRKLPAKVQDRIFEKIEELAHEPRHHNTKKLKDFNLSGLDFEEYYRTRVGDYRIIYAIEDKTITITVVKVDHRKDVYKR